MQQSNVCSICFEMSKYSRLDHKGYGIRCASPFSLLLWLSVVNSSRASLPVSLFTVLCADHCQSSCMSYQTPLQHCYNPLALFPNDSSWDEFDVFDLVLNELEFTRSFFGTVNGSCSGDPTDVFRLRVSECVGPFGKPRPWGNFTFVNDATPN